MDDSCGDTKSIYLCIETNENIVMLLGLELVKYDLGRNPHQMAKVVKYQCVLHLLENKWLQFLSKCLTLYVIKNLGETQTSACDPIKIRQCMITLKFIRRIL